MALPGLASSCKCQHSTGPMRLELWGGAEVVIAGSCACDNG